MKRAALACALAASGYLGADATPGPRAGPDGATSHPQTNATNEAAGAGREDLSALPLRDRGVSALQLDVAVHGGTRGRLRSMPTPIPMKTVKHRKEAGNSYLEGSPLYAREQQRVPAREATTSKSPAAEPITPPKAPILSWTRMPLTSPWQKVSALVTAHVLFALCIVMWAYLYRAHGKFRYTRDMAPYHGNAFTFGLFRVGDLQQDGPICAMACCCPAIRWADTMTKARLLPFWTALGLMIVMMLLMPITYGAILLLIVLVGVYFRQRLRKLYGHGPFQVRSLLLDCLAWSFCGPCAILQEAREVEKVQREPAAPPQQHVQMPRGGTSRGGQPLPPASGAPGPQQRLQAWQGTSGPTLASLPGSTSSLRLVGGNPRTAADK